MPKKQAPTFYPPSIMDSLTEMTRTLFEGFSLAVTHGNLIQRTPRSSSRPILVVPGLGAGDITTSALRHFLEAKGHKTYGWDGGVNTGPSTHNLAHLKRRFEYVAARHPKEDITLIGHSLGGIFVRELARAHPQRVGHVMTLGSPFGAAHHPNPIVPAVKKAFELVNGKNHAYHEASDMARQAIHPPPVPTTSVYTRGDGIVSWQACLNPCASSRHKPHAENIEVYGSHVGLPFNPLALLVIADRLAKVEKGKRSPKFCAGDYHGFRFPVQRGEEIAFQKHLAVA